MHTQISQLPRRRRIVDAMTRRIVGLGGAAAIAAIALIFFYLVWVAAPLLGSASIDRLSSIRLPSPTVLALGVDDGLESLYSIDAEGSIHFVVPETGEHLRSERLGSGPLPNGTSCPSDPRHLRSGQPRQPRPLRANSLPRAIQ